jgi:oligoendopeptidase F
MTAIDQIKTKWDLSPLLNGDQDPKIARDIAEAQKAYGDFIKKWKNRQDYLELPQVLKEALDDFEALANKYDGIGAIGYYFWLRYHQDQANPDIKSQNNKLSELEVKIANEMEFFTNRLGKVSPQTQKVFISYPELKPYRHLLERLFETSRYTLSEPEEKILNLKNQTSFSNWVLMVSELVSKEEREVLDESGERVTKSLSDFIGLLNSQNKNVREASAKATNEVLAKHAEIAEHEMNSILLDKKIDDELRGLERPDRSRHLADDLNTEVVDALTDAVSARFDLSNRYYRLKAKIMGVPRLAYHERNVTLGDLGRRYPYEKAVELVGETFKALDQSFFDIFDDMIKNGRIDVYPEKGRCGDAFCTHKRLQDPVYILLTHTDKLNDVLTLGHEMGHAINNVLIARTQNALNNDTPISTAEVASTFMEDFVFEKASKDYSSKDRLYLIMEKLNDDVSTIFRQVACYKFEQELHKSFREKNYLTKEEIGELFTKQMKSYMGDWVEQTPGCENWWVYWSHIRAFFYVYSYASGLLISKSLQNMVRGDKTQIDKVKKFLSAGLSESPKKLFMDMGIDISDVKFWNRGLDEIETLLKEAESLVEL